MTSRTSWERFFDGHAPVYDENCFTKNALAEVDFLVEELGLAPGAAVLDVGCGTGRHAVELARRGMAVTGMDISAGMLAEAERRAAAAGATVAWVHGDAARLDFAARFDAAVCLCEGAFGLLGAGDDALGQPRAILAGVARALKPGAPCLFTVLNGLAMIRRHGAEDVAAGRFDPLTLTERSDVEAGADAAELRERGFVPTELRFLFAEAGLAVDEVWGGTAGAWHRRPVDPDEMEIMVVARRGPRGADGEAP